MIDYDPNTDMVVSHDWWNRNRRVQTVLATAALALTMIAGAG